VLKCCFDQHHMLARIVTKIEVYHTLLKLHICNLNMYDPDKIGLSGYDLGQDIIQMTLMARFGQGSLGRK
jgi:hypothetical protein